MPALRLPSLTAIALAILASATPTIAAAQQTDAATAQAVAQGAPPAPTSSPVSTPTALSISSTLGTTDASIKGSFSLPSITPNDQATNILSLTFSTPISKSPDQQSNLLTLDGLAESTSIELEYSHFDIATANSAVVADVDKCVADEKVALGDAIEFLKLDNKPTAQAEALLTAIGASPTCVDVILNTATQFAARTGIDRNLMPSKVRDDLDAWEKDAKAAAQTRQKGRALVWGLTGKVGYDEHTWYSASSLAKSQGTRTPASVGAFFTYVAPGWNWAATVQFQHQQTYTDGTAKVLCPPGAGVVTCVSGSIGAPKYSEEDLVSLELRYSIPIHKWVGGSSIGLAPLASYDVHSGAYAFSLPVYLFGDGKSLNGGVSVNWSSLTHSTAAGVFVNQPLSIPGQGAPSN